MTGSPSIYEWVGGSDAIARWLDCFYDAVEQDDLLSPVFGGRVTREHRDGVAAWWSEVMGGPSTYTDQHGGYPHMVSKHRGLNISDAQRLRFVTLLSRAADEASIPDDPEARSALMAYAEWGSRIAVTNSAAGATPPPRAPVPKWGWGVAPPYQPR